MKSFLFINLTGDFLSLHQRIEAEGHKCFSWYSPDCLKGKGDTGKNMIEKVPDHFDVLNEYQDKKDDLVILIDDNSRGDLCTYLQAEGWHVVGSSTLSDTMEHDRGMGNKLAKKIGLQLPPTQTFTDFKSGLKYLEDVKKKSGEGVRFVFKADGVDLAGSSKTYLARDIEDMMWFMGWVEKDQTEHNYCVEKYELQLVIDGLETDYAVWFNGKQFAPVVPLTFEQKKIHGLGAAQGCLGQIMTFCDPKKEPYFKEYLSKLAPIIAGTNPCEWAANNIVAEKNHKPYFLEWTPRFGWDSTFGELALLQDAGKPIGEFFEMMAFGKPFPKDYFPYYRYSAAARLFSEGIGAKGDCVKGKPIWWDERYSENFWWYGIACNDNGMYEITDNPIGVATACGDTPEEAVAKLYKIIKPESGIIKTPDIFYSETIGEGIPERINKLQDWGLLFDHER